MHTSVASLLSLAASGTPLSREQCGRLVPLAREHLLDILALARLAASAGGSSPYFCGLANAKSGRCPENCAFCAQSSHFETGSPIYALVSSQSLLRRAEELASQGMRYMGIVISGTAPTGRDFERLCADAAIIRERVDIRLCASFGLLDAAQALALKQAGFTSYHHNLETAPSHYAKVCGSHSIERRIETVRLAEKAGLRVCCGGIFGLGESWEQRLELAETLAELQVDSIPVNFLNPIPGTPLEHAPPLPPWEALAVTALVRLMHPARDIVICGGRAKILGDWDRLLFPAGANAMISGDYLTTKGSAVSRDMGMRAVLGI